MGQLVLRRLGATIPVLLLVTAGVFLLLHLTPGDPIDVMMAESVDATVKEHLRRELGLDRPLHVQYAAWMGRLLRGDLGRSIRNGEPVIENVSRRLRPSLELAFAAMTISLVVAFPVGIVSAIRRNTSIDRAGATFALFGICMPNFLLALLLIFFGRIARLFFFKTMSVQKFKSAGWDSLCPCATVRSIHLGGDSGLLRLDTGFTPNHSD